MGLVDHEALELAAAVQEVQRLAEAGRGDDPFGRDVEQRQAAAAHVAAPQLREDVGTLLLALAAGEEVGAHALLAHGLHLVLDERDERADHHGEPVLEHRGQLIAERLAAARGHDDEDVAARHGGVDDGALVLTELAVAEDALERAAELAAPLEVLVVELAPGGGGRSGSLDL